MGHRQSISNIRQPNGLLASSGDRGFPRWVPPRLSNFSSSLFIHVTSTNGLNLAGAVVHSLSGLRITFGLPSSRKSVSARSRGPDDETLFSSPIERRP